MADPPSRWDGAGGQFAAGVGGGALGAVVGGFSGAVLGGAFQDGEGWDAMGSIILGTLAGASLGGTTATAFSVKLASSDAYPTRSMLPAWGGSVLGVVAGALVVQQVAAHSPEDVKWGFWPGFATIVTCSSLGAVLVDRAVATPASLSIGPWTPGGRAGAVAIARF